MEHIHIQRLGDAQIIEEYKRSFQKISLEALVEDYNKQVKCGITGVHRQALYLIALRLEFKERLGNSPVYMKDDLVLGMKGTMQLINGKIQAYEDK